MPMLRQPLRTVSRWNSPYVCVSCKVLGASPARPARYYSAAVESSTSTPSHADVGVHASGSGSADVPSDGKEKMDPHRFTVRKVKGKKGTVLQLHHKISSPAAPAAEQKPAEQSAEQPAEPAEKPARPPLSKRARKKELAARRRASHEAHLRRQTTKSKLSKTTKAPVAKPKPKATEPTQEAGVPLIRSTTTLEEDSITSRGMHITALNTESTAVPRLSYGLDRVLFNPGVYHLQDPRSRVYNFDPYLRLIMPVWEFDFDVLNEYITSSRDTKLRALARERNLKYIGSSSSMTSVLSHFHYLLSQWRPIDTSMMSQGFTETSKNFTKLLRAPTAVFLRHKDGIYAIDADKEFDTANILMNLGKSMERLLTMPTDQFERYRKSSGNKMTSEESDDEAYHYTTMGDFLMRGQLDAYDPRLPGTGMFDLKTRAVLSIRMDAKNYEHGLGYQLKNLRGDYESFEREYFDMIRAAFLKYSLQVRIGRMDGIFVAYHNTERIFGFQYISLAEMDRALHGQEDTLLGDAEFKLSLSLWNKVLNRATETFPGQSIRLHFETRETQIPFMYIFAEPVTDEEIDAIQTRNKKEIDEYQKKLLFPELFEGEKEAESAEETPEESESEANLQKDVVSTTEGSMEMSVGKDGPKVTESKATEHAKQTSTEETSKEPAEEQEPRKPLLAMALSIENVLNNNKRVIRPETFVHGNTWTVNYRLSSFSEDRGHELYAKCQKRRQTVFGEGPSNAFQNRFREMLKTMSQKGREWRERCDRRDEKKGIVWLNDGYNGEKPKHQTETKIEKKTDGEGAAKVEKSE